MRMCDVYRDEQVNGRESEAGKVLFVRPFASGETAMDNVKAAARSHSEMIGYDIGQPFKSVFDRATLNAYAAKKTNERRRGWQCERSTSIVVVRVP